jgi:ADP-heptose:LPS heptosyltransferase
MTEMNFQGVGNLWKEDIPTRQFKPVSSSVMRQLGLNRENVRKVNDLVELRGDPPNIVIAEAVKNVRFVQNFFKEQTLTKRSRYVMGLGVFQQLHADQQGRKLLKPTSLRFKNIYRPYTGQDVEGKTVLVFRTGGIGDLLFIQPNLRYLKEKYDCEIKFACGPQYQPMVRNWKCVDEVIDLPFSADVLIKSKYHMLFEGVIERCKEAETINAYRLFSKWLGLNLPDEKLVPKQTAKEELLDECSKIIEQWGIKDFVVMQLRASSPVRTPRHEFWIKIINDLNKNGINVVLTDNPRQSDNIQKFINLLNEPNKTFNFCQYSKSIDYTIALTALSKGTISTDSALCHIAASLERKCFGIYGPFPGKIRLETYPKAYWVDAVRHCAPCFIHGHKPCPYANSDGYSPCYDELIDTDEKLNSLIYSIKEFINA